MKKPLFLVMICVILNALAGCGTKMPAKALDGAPWNNDWITLGQVLGVEKPGHGLTLRDDKAAQNMCYTAWSIGEAQPYTDASGKETNLYDAQLVILLTAFDTAEEARTSADEWLALASDNYSITDTVQQTYNGQEFTVLTYALPPDTSPFSHGVSAVAVFDTWTVSAEFVCQDTFEEDAGEILADVLEHCHYAV